MVLIGGVIAIIRLTLNPGGSPAPAASSMPMEAALPSIARPTSSPPATLTAMPVRAAPPAKSTGDARDRLYDAPEMPVRAAPPAKSTATAAASAAVAATLSPTGRLPRTTIEKPDGGGVSIKPK
jgi:hypothetical protein